MRILFLTHRLPYALNRGDRIRAYYLLREMARFASVSLFSLVHDDEEAAAVPHLPFATAVRVARVTRVRNALLGTARLPSRRPLTHSLLDAPGARRTVDDLAAAHPPDVVVAFCSSMAKFVFQPAFRDLPVVIDMVDVDSAKWRQLATVSGWPRRWIYRREAVTLERFEAEAVGRAAVTLVVNARERETLQRIAPRAAIEVIESGVDLESFARPNPPSAEPVVIFSGVMNYAPNEEGVRWFAEDVWPRVRSVVADARFLVVGSSPSRATRDLAMRDPSIEVVGPVEKMQPYLWRSAVSVAPLLVARGLQNKVLEALASGLPVVVTPIVFEGLPQAARPGCLAAENAAAFADAVVDLLRRSPEERARQAAGADLGQLTWAGRMAPLEGLIRQACARPPTRGSSDGRALD